MLQQIGNIAFMKRSLSNLNSKRSPRHKTTSESNHFPVLLSAWQRLPSSKKKDFCSFERFHEVGLDMFGVSVDQYLARLKGLTLLKSIERLESAPPESAFQTPKSMAYISRQHSARKLDQKFSKPTSSSRVVELKYKKALKRSISPHSILIGSVDAANNLSTLKTFNVRAVISVGAEDDFITHSYIQGYLKISYQDHTDLTKVISSVERFMALHLQKGSVMIAGLNMNINSAIVCAYLMRLFRETAGKVCKVAKLSDPDFKISRRLYDELKSLESVVNPIRR